MIWRKLLFGAAAALMIAGAAVAAPIPHPDGTFDEGVGAGGFESTISFTPTVQNAAYSASNAIGGLQTVSVFRASGMYSGIFTNFWIASKGGNTVAMTVYVFDTNPSASTCTDKSAFSLNSADISKLAVKPFVLTPAVPQGATAAVDQYTAPISVANHDTTAAVSGTGTRNLYVCIVANGTVTPASTTDVIAKISLILD